MSALNRPARLNRSLLGLLGVVVAAAGGFAIAAHLGRVSRVDSGAPLVPGTEDPPRWVFYLAVAGAVIVGLGCLRWIAAQLVRLPRPVRWQLGVPDPSGETVLDSDIAAAPLAAEVESYGEVDAVTARLAGLADSPQLHLVVTAAADADLTELRRRILGHAVPRLRQALEVEVIPVTMELRLADRGRTR
ncbi:hypothetical protein [Nocardia pseudobrasiliensis]|uniref:Uncharacterized protein n=1 Tax=Nocardia pseudobrasiliensis TaxID=45979 RepID=A0A370IEK7_9NOCA|nr:hypothetical protein [Nocardia pseudobrasiliensis]RDI69010.1 hypothetical protein DFR76_101547 [Nocardia pseudobrasiliensis]